MGNICSEASNQKEVVSSKNKSIHQSLNRTESALLGDIGGTNLRLALHRLDVSTRTSVVIEQLTIYSTNNFDYFEDAIKLFLGVRTHILTNASLGHQTWSL